MEPQSGQSKMQDGLIKDNGFDIQGFDVHMGNNWIYPINSPIRSYQFKIIEKTLYNNTLVSKNLNI